MQTSRRSVIAALLLSMVAVGAACATLGRATFREPVVTLKNVTITGLGLQGGSLDVVLSVYNPNHFQLDALRMTYNVDVDSVPLGTGALDGRFTVPSGDSSDVRLPVSFTYAGLGVAGASLMRLGALNYRVRGDFTVSTPPVEKVILVAAPLKRSSARQHAEDHLDELARLADTAGADVVGTLTQQLDRPHPATYLGSGKVEELKQRIGELGATLVIFDDELSPAQGKNVEQIVNTRVMDRAELILDIFATRARSNEARLQVELAQLKYMLPRLTRMWTHLEKFRGGIGVRGPGETQLESDRRLIQQRIRVLNDRLAEVDRARDVQRQGRENHFRVALVGYTNAGKSSVLRTMANDREVFVEDRLFATLDPLTREIDMGEGYTALLTDTVGFIRKLPHHLVASFRATLAEAREADLLLHVIDASHATWEEQRDVVHDVLAELELTEKPTLHLLNKMDALSPADAEALRVRVGNLMPGSLFVSAIERNGLDPLRDALREAIRTKRPLYEIRIPVANGRLLADVHRDGEVLDQRHDDEVMVVRARLDERAIGKLRHAGARVTVTASARNANGARALVLPDGAGANDRPPETPDAS